MAKASQLEKVLCRHTRQYPNGHQELVDSFKRLHSLIERLSQHLSRQDLKGILSDISGQPPASGTPSPTSTQRLTDDD